MQETLKAVLIRPEASGLAGVALVTAGAGGPCFLAAWSLLSPFQRARPWALLEA